MDSLYPPDELYLRHIKTSDLVKRFKLDREFLALEMFLRKQAIPFHTGNVAKTFVLSDSADGGQIIAYLTLVCSEIVSNEQTNGETTKDYRYNNYPAVKLARFAVDRRYAGKNVGRSLIDWCLGHIAISIMPNSGCRFLVLDAKQESVGFYERVGFSLLDTQENRECEHPVMFIDLHKVTQ